MKQQPKYSAEELRQIELIRRKLALLTNPRHISYDFITLARIGAQMRVKVAGRKAA